MKPNDLVLAAIAAGDGAIYTPVQIQKLLFLIDKRIPKAVGGPHFNFEPYHYGPFDRAVFDVLDQLEAKGLVEIERQSDRRWKTYRLTQAGKRQGGAMLNSLKQSIQDYIARLSSYVRSMSFAQLVSAIYYAYPDMKANSVFAG